ncbi:MAG: hypothetical protein M1820_005260 [Bogoriella megaspora]|nr:MAG: hypothetical protein M1820_005260 [Bogoriella megaspora]
MATFITIPLETRRQIYEYLLDLDFPDNVVVKSPPIQKVKHLNILYTNRQIHREAGEVFHSMASFVLVQAPTLLIDHTWLNDIGVRVIAHWERGQMPTYNPGHSMKVMYSLVPKTGDNNQDTEGETDEMRDVTDNGTSNDPSAHAADMSNEDHETLRVPKGRNLKGETEVVRSIGCGGGIMVRKVEASILARYLPVREWPSVKSWLCSYKKDSAKILLDITTGTHSPKAEDDLLNPWLAAKWIQQYENSHTVSFSGILQRIPQEPPLGINFVLEPMKLFVIETKEHAIRGKIAGCTAAIQAIFGVVANAWAHSGEALTAALEDEHEKMILDMFDHCFTATTDLIYTKNAIRDPTDRGDDLFQLSVVRIFQSRWRKLQDRVTSIVLARASTKIRLGTDIIASMLALALRPGSTLDPVAWTAMWACWFVSNKLIPSDMSLKDPRFPWPCGKARVQLLNRVDLKEVCRYFKA